MNNKNQKILAVVSVALIVILIAMQFGGDDSGSSGRLFACGTPESHKRTPGVGRASEKSFEIEGLLLQ